MAGPVTTAPGPAPGKATYSKGLRSKPQRVMIYGQGGMGKSTLAALAPNPILIDLERRSNAIDVARLDNIDTWDALRTTLKSSDEVKAANTVIVDTLTRAEELATAWTLLNVPHEKGGRVGSVEGYGFGKGYQHVYETFLNLLADLDALIERGQHVIVVCHDCTADFPNPEGEDFIRYEPRLYTGKSGKSSIRNRVFEWCDTVMFISLDIAAIDGKGKGQGSRTIYRQARPTWMAKGSGSVSPFPWNDKTDGKIWKEVLA